MAILKKFIGANTIGSEKIQLENDQSFFALNSSSAEVALFKLDSASKLQFQVLPQVSSDPSAANDLVRKSYLDAEIAGAAGDITALEGRVTDIENDYGAANGLATLGADGKIPSSQVPAIAITDVYVVANIVARDALTVEEGDVAKVSDAGAGLPKTYIYDGASWIEIESGSDVDSVNGYTGVVVLATSDVAESGLTNLYYTPARQAAIEAYADQAEADAISSANSYTDGEVAVLEGEDLTFLKLDGSRSMTQPLNMGSQKIVSLSDGVASSDAATKGQLDTEVLALETEDTTFLKLDGTRTMNAALNMGSHKIIQLTDGVAASDAATVGQVDAAESAANSYTDAQLDTLSVQELAHESKTLVAGDITNGYVDVAFDIQGQPWVQVGRVSLVPGDDFTVSGSRITFAGSVAAAGAEALEAGDKLSIFYMKSVQPYV